MSTREIALSIFDQLNEEQLRGFIAMFGEMYPAVNSETRAALSEAEDIAANPEKYKSYSSFSEIMNEIDKEIDKNA